MLPTGIYTIPELSSVGETEESLQAKGIPYVVGKGSFVENARANLIGEAVGWVKLLARRADLKSWASTSSGRTPPSSSTWARR